jgi:hypothetical protein
MEPGQPCVDAVGFTQVISSSGTWKIRLVDGANDETSTEPSAGDKVKLIIPQNGLIDQGSYGCLLTFAPTAPITVTGTYDDHDAFTFGPMDLPVATSGGSCPLPPLTTSVFKGTYTFSPGVSDGS